MRRIFTLMLALILGCVMLAPSFAEEGAPEAIAYDFDIQFHLNAAAFPAHTQARTEGYADLLDNLIFRGTYTRSTTDSCFSLALQVIPVSNPDAAISLTFYGVPSHVALTSPLMGNERIFFNNMALIEFAMKAYNHLGVHLPWLALLYPYATENAFSQLILAWNNNLGDLSKSTTISQSQLAHLAADWDYLLGTDDRLRYWLEAISLESDGADLLTQELYSIPIYLQSQFSTKGNLKLKVSGGTKTWSNRKGVIIQENHQEGSSSLAIDLPATDRGFIPTLHYDAQTQQDSRTISLLLDYSTPSLPDSGEPYTLLSLNLDAAFPAAWPQAASLSSTLALSGHLLPAISLRSEFTSTATGSLEMLLFDTDSNQELPFLRVTGTVQSTPLQSVTHYQPGELITLTNVFSVNDNTLKDLERRIWKPLLRPLLSFLSEIPASSCQSVMDDLEDSGILDVLLGD